MMKFQQIMIIILMIYLVVLVNCDWVDETVLDDGPNLHLGTSVSCQGCCQPSAVPGGADTVTVSSGQYGG